MTDNNDNISILNAKPCPLSNVKDKQLLNNSDACCTAQKLEYSAESHNANKKIVHTPTTKKKARCFMTGCRKKLTLTSIECRCKHKFCHKHILAEKHDCTFDYKTKFKNETIAKKGLGGGIADRVIDRL
jgi:predicted nucleic acid binding AN1-type Zn finger protein